MKLRFTWSPDQRQMGEAARAAVADPDCDVHLKRIKEEEDRNRASTRVGSAVDRVVDAEGTELEKAEVERRIAPYVEAYPGDNYVQLPSILLKHWAKPRPKLNLVDAMGLPLDP